MKINAGQKLHFQIMLSAKPATDFILIVWLKCINPVIYHELI